jgi:thiosulfate dehydrogenase (quinone) large subunit
MKNFLFGPHNLEDAPAIKAIFNSPKFAWLWLIVRVYLGYQWVTASLHKLSSPDWMQTGAAIKGFWMHAVAIPEAPAKPAITFDWYRSFLQSLIDSNAQVWFGKLIAVGELLVGIALIAGIFVGMAAFFSFLMNLNFMLAGSNSTGPLLLVLAMLLMIAWKLAGYYGLNRLWLKYVGTFWQPGIWFKKKVVTS